MLAFTRPLSLQRGLMVFFALVALGLGAALLFPDFALTPLGG